LVQVISNSSLPNISYYYLPYVRPCQSQQLTGYSQTRRFETPDIHLEMIKQLQIETLVE
jgi:hypothetical protein